MAFSPPAKPAITAAEIPSGWIEDVRSVVQREGRAVRGNVFGPICIEVQDLASQEWHRLGFTFVNETERDTVLEQLNGKGAAAAVQPPAP